MPYVPQNIRDYYDPLLDQLTKRLGFAEFVPGDLNYCITRLLIAAYVKNPSYGTINLLMGVLKCVGKEFYRRLGAMHERKACIRNGDVFPFGADV